MSENTQTVVSDVAMLLLLIAVSNLAFEVVETVHERKIISRVSKKAVRVLKTSTTPVKVLKAKVL